MRLNYDEDLANDWMSIIYKDLPINYWCWKNKK